MFDADISGHSGGFLKIRLGTMIDTLPRSTIIGSAVCKGVPKDALSVHALHV